MLQNNANGWKERDILLSILTPLETAHAKNHDVTVIFKFRFDVPYSCDASMPSSYMISEGGDMIERTLL